MRLLNYLNWLRSQPHLSKKISFLLSASQRNKHNEANQYVGFRNLGIEYYFTISDIHWEAFSDFNPFDMPQSKYSLLIIFECIFLFEKLRNQTELRKFLCGVTILIMILPWGGAKSIILSLNYSLGPWW